MFTCEFCQTSCTTLSNLRAHQTHTKACLDIQEKAPPPKPVCRYCGESYSKPARLRAHEERCDRKPTPLENMVAMLNQQNQALSKENQDLHMQIAILEERSKNHLSHIQQLEWKMERRMAELINLAVKKDNQNECCGDMKM